MLRTWCLPLAGLALACGMLAAPAQPAVAGRAPIAVQESETWSGYAVAKAPPYTSVSAAWIEPTVSCTAADSAVSFFVGMDAYANGYYENIGTKVDCSGGTPDASGWYSLFPKSPVTLSNPVQPGDHFTGSVTDNTSGLFTLVLTDTTQGWSRTITKSLSVPRESAEVIVDDPDPQSGLRPLADFGTVQFTSVMVNGEKMSDSQPTRIQMTRNSGSGLKASITGLAGGQTFGVTWLHST